MMHMVVNFTSLRVYSFLVLSWHPRFSYCLRVGVVWGCKELLIIYWFLILLDCFGLGCGWDVLLNDFLLLIVTKLIVIYRISDVYPSSLVIVRVWFSIGLSVLKVKLGDGLLCDFTSHCFSDVIMFVHCHCIIQVIWLVEPPGGLAQLTLSFKLILYVWMLLLILLFHPGGVLMQLFHLSLVFNLQEEVPLFLLGELAHLCLRDVVWHVDIWLA